MIIVGSLLWHANYPPKDYHLSTTLKLVVANIAVCSSMSNRI